MNGEQKLSVLAQTLKSFTHLEINTYITRLQLKQKSTATDLKALAPAQSELIVFGKLWLQTNSTEFGAGFLTESETPYYVSTKKILSIE
jgi:hypothetical protein